jgi:hypothetical protein
VEIGPEAVEDPRRQALLVSGIEAGQDY